MFCADWALMFGFCGASLHQLRAAGFSDDALLAAPAPAVLGAVSGTSTAVHMTSAPSMRSSMALEEQTD